MPRKLLATLVAEGHEADSVKSLQLAGIDNGALYQMAASNYDLCFTRDAEFSRRVLSKPAARLKLVHVIFRKPDKRNSCCSSSPRFGKQIGQVIKAATIGRSLNSASENEDQWGPDYPLAMIFCPQLTAATTEAPVEAIILRTWL